MLRNAALLALSGALLGLACEGSSKSFETADGGSVGGTGGNATAGSGGARAGSPGSAGSPQDTSGGEAGADTAGGSSGSPGGTGGTAPGASGEGGSPSDAGGASGSAAAGSGGIPIDSGPTEIARVLCDRIFDCCTEAELMGLPLNLGDSESSCQLGVAVYLAVIAEASKESIAAGRIDYDGVALAGCLERYGGEECALLRGLSLDICPEVFAPQVELGGACGISAECIDGYCDGSNDGANPVGQCAAKKQVGAGCAANDECESGLCEALGEGCVATVEEPLCGG